MATIKDVAKAAGVSVATVSRVMNGDTVVTSSTCAKVKRVIEELKYTPNMLGRNLRRRETKKILVFLNTISNPFYSRVVRGIETAARENGYAILICMTHNDCEIEDSYLDMLRTKLYDGAVFLAAETEGEKLQATLHGIPTVQACETKDGFNTSVVSIDNQRAAYEATCYLIEKGHRRIAFCGGGDSYESSRLRKKGYTQALSEQGIEISTELLFDDGFSFNAGIRCAEKIVEKGLCDALFCCSDSSAAGAIKLFMAQGLNVPRDVSVMGFDDTQFSQIYNPAITTTRQPQFEIGYQAFIELLGQIENPTAPNKTVMLKHQIVERDSVFEKGR